MYVIGHVIYGAPVTQEVTDLAESRNESLDEEEDGYFAMFYHGGGEPAGYIGIELTSFDECGDLTFTSIDRKPSDAQIERAEKKIVQLPREYQDALPKTQRWIVWSTS